MASSTSSDNKATVFHRTLPKKKTQCELVNKYALYTPKANHGHRKRGCPKMSKDKLPTEQEIRNLAANRDGMEKDCFRLKINLICSRID